MVGDIEEVAEKLYQTAGFELSAQAPPVLLARRLMGDAAVRTVPDDVLQGSGALVRVGDEWRVYLRAGAANEVKRFVLLHELAHWALGPSATEGACDALAAALLVPRPAFLAAVGRHGRRLPILAHSFGTTESCVGLRLGETTKRATALVSPQKIRLRGAGYRWPSAAALRELALADHVPGLRKAKLRDDPGSVLLSAG